MKVEELIKQVNETYEKNINNKVVFGEATEKEGVTIIPVSKVIAKVGQGQTFNIRIGNNEWKNTGKETDKESENNNDIKEEIEKKIEKVGYGIDARMTPIGFIEIKDGKATFKPVIDIVKLATMGICYAAFFVFMFTRMITRIAKLQSKHQEKYHDKQGKSTK